MPPIFNPKGSVCVVTGGASGIGKALCHRLASLGAAKVVVADIDFASAEDVAKREMPGGVGVARSCDCGNEGELRRLILETELDHGPISAFFCNAGMLGGIHGGGFDVTNEEFERMMAVNVMQSVYVARHLFPKFVERGKGALMVTSSAAGLLTLTGNLPYSLTKHGAVAVAEWLRIRYGGGSQRGGSSSGILVSCLCPQAVDTGMTGGLDPTAAWGGKLMTPEQVAQIALDGMAEGRFMILPHEDVRNYFSIKARDYEKWTVGMQGVHRKYDEAIQNLNSKL